MFCLDIEFVKDLFYTESAQYPSASMLPEKSTVE